PRHRLLAAEKKKTIRPSTLRCQKFVKLVRGHHGAPASRSVNGTTGTQRRTRTITVVEACG
ncbi:hypothetical protein OS493_032484, partial [Desmophyllum pertusum]